MSKARDNIIIVCYPGGAGGSFVAANLHSVLWNTKFIVNLENGNCHLNYAFKQNPSLRKFPNIEHGPTTQSLEQELYFIKQTLWSAGETWSGHFRNIVAMRETIEKHLGYDAANQIIFVKIKVDPNNDHHSIFLSNILRKKANSFPDLNDEDFLQQTLYHIENWYWVESYHTQKQTVDLDLEDVFSKGLEIKFSHLLTDQESENFQKNHQRWLDLQHSLYPEMLELLYD
jgi:hypothetical protein